MPKRKIKTCLLCGHIWKPYVENPKKCPHCANANWNKEKTNKARNLPHGIYKFHNKDVDYKGYVAYHKNQYLGLFKDVDKAQAAIDEFKKSEKTFFNNDCKSAEVLIGKRVRCTNSDKFANKGIGFIGKLQSINFEDDKPYICFIGYSKQTEAFKTITGRIL